MPNAGKVIIFLCAFFSLAPLHAHALSEKDLVLTDDPFHKKQQLVAQQKQAELENEKQEAPGEASETEAAADPEVQPPVTHTVASGENLTKIAASYSLTWQRLFDKNTQLADPNILHVGDVVTIPKADEQLPQRPIPMAAPAVQPIAAARSPRSAATTTTPVVSRSSSAGNTYAPGYCTWYAKNRRPDLPNRMGNASSWVASAARQGFATGFQPRAGAIGQQGNHVVYVEAVHGDGTITVSEMNYRGLFVISSRTAAASSFRYIY